LIKPSTVRGWQGHLDEQKLSENYKLVPFTALSGVLDSAVDGKLIRENPRKAKTIRRPSGSSSKVVVWLEERLTAVCGGLPERFSGTGPAPGSLRPWVHTPDLHPNFGGSIISFHYKWSTTSTSCGGLQ
jgi:hypothetical protein